MLHRPLTRLRIAAAYLAKLTGAFRQQDAAAINRIIATHPKPKPVKKHARHRALSAKQRRLEKGAYRSSYRR